LKINRTEIDSWLGWVEKIVHIRRTFVKIYIYGADGTQEDERSYRAVGEERCSD
jgi:hypothetical protein